MVKERLAPSSKSLARKRILVSLLVITPLGFSLKLYAGPAQNWVNNYAAGVLYEIFWCLVLLFFWPDRECTAYPGLCAGLVLDARDSGVK